MIVTIEFADTPGPQQIKSITLKVDTDDFVEAVVRTIAFITTITTIPISSVTIMK